MVLHRLPRKKNLYYNQPVACWLLDREAPLAQRSIRVLGDMQRFPFVAFANRLGVVSRRLPFKEAPVPRGRVAVPHK